MTFAQFVAYDRPQAATTADGNAPFPMLGAAPNGAGHGNGLPPSEFIRHLPLGRVWNTPIGGDGSPHGPKSVSGAERLGVPGDDDGSVTEHPGSGWNSAIAQVTPV